MQSDLSVFVIRSIIENSFDVLDVQDRGFVTVEELSKELFWDFKIDLEVFFREFQNLFEHQKLRFGDYSKRQTTQNKNIKNVQKKCRISRECYTHFIQKLISIQTPEFTKKLLKRLGYCPETFYSFSKRIYNLSVHSIQNVSKKIVTPDFTDDKEK